MPDDTSPAPEEAFPGEPTRQDEKPKGAEAAPPPDPVATLEQKVASLEKEKKDTYERLLRSAADFENYKKRVRREIDDTLLKAREQVLREMLPVVDNLERALGAAAGDGNSVLDGVRLVLRQFGSALEKFDVKAVEAVGKPFDPSVHEAISQVESKDQPAGTVVSEMQRGYTLGPRLLRPAMVAVSRRPAGEDTSASPPAVEAAPADGPATIEVEVTPEKTPVDGTPDATKGEGT